MDIRFLQYITMTKDIKSHTMATIIDDCRRVIDGRIIKNFLYTTKQEINRIITMGLIYLLIGKFSPF